MNYPRRFVFHANACGVSLHIRRPGDHVLAVQGASAIPPTGGISESKTGAKTLKHFVRFDFAETAAAGDFADEPAALEATEHKRELGTLSTRTTAMSKVGGLRFGKSKQRHKIEAGKGAPNWFEAGLIEARMVSLASPERRGEASFQLERATFDSLVVNGYPLNITTDLNLYNRNDTHTKLQEAHKSGLTKAQQQMFHAPTDTAAALYASNGIAYGTIVRKLDWPKGKPAGLRELGVNAFYLEDFGALYFGELLLAKASRRLSMIRFQLGSDAFGQGDAGYLETNGSYWP